MRVGSLVYCTDQGLGILAKSLYEVGVITDVVVVPHSHWHNNYDWYPNAEKFSMASARRMVDSVDSVLFLETAYDWSLIPYAQAQGKKVSLMTMYECTPKELPARPDQFICPSSLDFKYYPTNSVQLTVPVNVPWRQRTRANLFIHNAGHGGLRGRNGTAELIQALRYVKSKAEFLIRSQKRLDVSIPPELSGRVRIECGTAPYERLYSAGDVFIFPEKFNGLSLPLQEAYASGMLVMCGARYPMIDWLPREPMIPVHSYRRSAVSPRCNEFDEAVYDPRDIAATIDRWYNEPIADFSYHGRSWAEANSWDKLRDRYLEVLT